MSPVPYISHAEWQCIELLHRDQPYLISPVIGTMLSLLRLNGVFNGARYIYWPQNDAAIRQDVHKLLVGMRQQAEKLARAEAHKRAKAAQGDLL